MNITYMKKQAFEALTFLRLTDREDGNLSLTSIALGIMLFRVATIDTLGALDLGALITVVAQYTGKKIVNASEAKGELSESVAAMGQSVAAVQALTAKAEARLALVEARTAPGASGVRR